MAWNFQQIYLHWDSLLKNGFQNHSEWHDHNDSVSNSFAHLKICALFSEELQVEIENRYEMPGTLLLVTVIHTLSAEPVIMGCVCLDIVQVFSRDILAIKGTLCYLLFALFSLSQSLREPRTTTRVHGSRLTADLLKLRKGKESEQKVAQGSYSKDIT